MARRLISWFFILIVLTVLSLSWMAYRTISQTFQSYRGDHTQAHLTDLPHTLAHYRNFHGSWDGIQREVEGFGTLLSMQIVLLDTDQRVLASTRNDEIGVIYNDFDWAEEVLPVVDQTLNVPIGAVLISRGRLLQAADNFFFEQLFRGSIITMLIVGGIAAAGSVLLARSLAAPLTRLSEATNKVVQGEYDVRVEEHDRDEIGLLGGAFNHMAAEIGKLERIRRDLVLNVSHDLRTPLMVVQGYLEALQSGKIADRRSAEIAFDSMALEITQLQNLIDGLNEVAALDAGKIPISLEQTDVAELIQTAISRVSWFAESKNISVKFQPQREKISAELDPEKFGQVLFNLLDNSIHYTHNGGQIKIDYRVENQQLHISIQDNGEGINEDEIPFIFERFFRGGHSKNRETSGYGMGLSIVKSIVQAHHGEISAKPNQLGSQGAFFEITLPLNHL